MSTNRKVTMELPENLIREATEATGKGLTETVRQGLKIIAARKAYTKLAELKGHLDLQLDIKKMRKDRK